MSTLNTSASSGTKTTPPPSPVRAPRKPAMNDPSPTRMVNSRLFKLPPKPVCHSRVGPVFGWLTTRDSLLGSFFEEAAQAAELKLLWGRRERLPLREPRRYPCALGSPPRFR